MGKKVPEKRREPDILICFSFNPKEWRRYLFQPRPRSTFDRKPNHQRQNQKCTSQRNPFRPMTSFRSYPVGLKAGFGLLLSSL